MLRENQCRALDLPRDEYRVVVLLSNVEGFSCQEIAEILIAICLEERDLLTAFGEGDAAYRRSVPMLIPGPGRQPASHQTA